MYVVLLSCIIIVIYSAFGGIKAVTFTDVIQFFTFGVVLPMVAFFIWISLDDAASGIFNTLESNPSFDFRHLINPSDPNFFNTMLVFLFFLIPSVDPAFFQRISMARNVRQATRSFLIAAILYMICEFTFIGSTGLLLVSDTSTPTLAVNSIVPYILNNYISIGFKGIFMIGLMAMAMSTADSYLNTTAILAYDFSNAIGIKFSEKTSLFYVRIVSSLAGICAIMLSTAPVSFNTFLNHTASIYMSVITVPFTLTIFGFRSTSKAILLGMLAGFSIVLILELQYTDTDAAIGNTVALGMTANLLALLGSHYLLGQKGGWIGVQDNGTFFEIQKERKERMRVFFTSITSFKIINYLQNTGTKQDSAYVYLGGLIIVSHLFSIYSLHKNLVEKHELLINALSYITLSLSTILISYPVWTKRFKSPVFISSIFHLLIFVFIFESSVFVLINNFGHMQIIIFTLSLILATMLLRWQGALIFIVSGIFCAAFFFKHYISSHIEFGSITVEATMFYLALMVCIICFAFLKPRSDTLQYLEIKSANLWQKVNAMDKEVRSANNIKTEFISNINHEVRTPMTGITSLSQALWDNYDHVPESKRRECVYTIAKNSERLISLMNNILDFSNLTSVKMPLHLKKTNITELVHDSLKRCKKLYLEDKDLRFNMDIGENIYANCDGHYISHTIDNLIINAISYSKRDTTVRIILEQHEGRTYFAVRDEGIGIPKEELATIFKPFTTSTKTQSPAGGRGVGLALCYAAITAHKGRIWAESDSSSWAKFSFEI